MHVSRPVNANRRFVALGKSDTPNRTDQTEPALFLQSPRGDEAVGLWLGAEMELEANQPPRSPCHLSTSVGVQGSISSSHWRRHQRSAVGGSPRMADPPHPSHPTHPSTRLRRILMNETFASDHQRSSAIAPDCLGQVIQSGMTHKIIDAPRHPRLSSHTTASFPLAGAALRDRPGHCRTLTARSCPPRFP